MDNLNEFIWRLSTYLWGLPLSALLTGVGFYLTIKLRLIQVRGFTKVFRVILSRPNPSNHNPSDGRKEQIGELSYFQALSTVLSSTIGTGNIVGVATAISVGGPGALPWMWVAALLGMAVKYSECVLALTYREQSIYGQTKGGPMYYIEKGLGKKYRPLALFFSLCGVIAALETGGMVQSNSISYALSEPFSKFTTLSPMFLKGAIGFIVFLASLLVIVGGLRRIARVASYLVPFMVVMYLFAGILSIILNRDKIVPALWEIIQFSSSPGAVAGGFAGSGIWLAMRMGIARGLFSNEAGLGSAPIAYAAIITDNPAKGALIALLEPFLDTIVVCTTTGLVITTSGLWKEGLTGAMLASQAFQSHLSWWGEFVVPFSLTIFAYTSILGWYYYGERCVEYLFGIVSLPFYKTLFLTGVLVGAVIQVEIVWNLADLANAFMALPNLVALVLLSDVVKERTEDYFRRNTRSHENKTG